MTTFALLDFESRSRADLTKIGGRLYWEHPSSEALCAVIDVEGDRQIWLPGDPPPYLGGLVLVAHNAFNFDRFAAAKTWHPSYADPTLWVDSSELAKRLGMRGALDALGGKDKEGSKFTKALSSVRKPPGMSAEAWRALGPAAKRSQGVMPDAVRPPGISPEEWKRMPPGDRIVATLTRVVEYCCSDVDVLVEWWPYLSQAIELDADVSAAMVAINDRGVRFDPDLALLLLAKDAELTDRTIDNVATGLQIEPERVREIAGSPTQFCEFTGAPNAQKAIVDELTKGGDEAALMARARQALASIVRGKVRAGLVRSSADGRMRDMHQYYGSHTGRASGAGFQPQNLTRPTGKDETGKEFETYEDADFYRLIDALLERPATDKEIDALLRPLLCAEEGNVLVAIDWSGIEARVLAWLAGDLEELENIRAGRDPYKVSAAQAYGVAYEDVQKPQRQAGKVLVLACGYGGGAGAVERFADTMKIDLAAAGITAEEGVRAWRNAHRPIVQFWYALEGGFRRAAQGEECEVGDFRFVPAPEESGVVMVLPSGRPVVYRNVREAGEERRGKRGLIYESRDPKKNFIPDDQGIPGAKVYGGLLAENAVQATCRCILARTLVMCHEQGIPVVMHVHDEVVSEVPRAQGRVTYDRMHAIMVSLPDWLRDPGSDRGDCPLAASGWIGERYHK